MGKFYRFCLEVLARLITLLPVNLQMKVGDFLGWLWFDLFRIRRDLVLNNLKKAYPEWTEGERVRVGRAAVHNLGRGFVEFCRIPNFDPDNDKYIFNIIGQENFTAAEQHGKGVCLMSLHLANGDWGVTGLAAAGYRFILVSKHFKVEWLNDFWFSARRRMGTRFLPPRNSSFAILKALKKGESVIFVQDQFMGPPVGVKSTFFGHETGSAMGLATMAQRSGAPVVPVYAVRNKDGSTDVTFDRPIPFEEKGNKEDTISHMTQVYNDKIEEYVRAHPDQWLWVHRRWKPFRDRRK